MRSARSLAGRRRRRRWWWVLWLYLSLSLARRPNDDGTRSSLYLSNSISLARPLLEDIKSRVESRKSFASARVLPRGASSSSSGSSSSLSLSFFRFTRSFYPDEGDDGFQSASSGGRDFRIRVRVYTLASSNVCIDGCSSRASRRRLLCASFFCGSMILL